MKRRRMTHRPTRTSAPTSMRGERVTAGAALRELLGDGRRKALRLTIEVLGDVSTAGDHVMEEELCHRVAAEPLAPVVRVAAEVDDAVSLLHLDLGIRREPQAGLAAISSDVNRYAHLATSPIVVPDEAVVAEVDSGIAVGRYDATARDRFNPRPQLQQQRVRQRRVDH